MKKQILFIVALFTMMSLQAQVVYDFESGATSTTFTHFGNSLDGSEVPAITNPNATGINESATVLEYVDAEGGEVWAGASTNIDPITIIPGTQICMDVHFDHIGSVSIKLEQSNTGGEDWILAVNNTTMGEWETICWSVDAPSNEGGAFASGTYPTATIFFDFGDVPATDVITYFDNLVFPGTSTPSESQIIFDFETPSTTTNYTYFGSTLDGQPAANIGNPNPTGINESPTVVEYVKAANSEVWAGAFADPAPTQPIDATNGGMLCVDVHYDHIGNIALKLEGGPEGTNWIQTVENTVMNEWEQVCIDLSLPGLEDSMNPATGNIYGQLVVFPDFGTAYDTDVVSYLDNMIFIPSTDVQEDAEVTFSVDMNNYAEAFTTAYVSGSFNDWSGDSNPMSDDDGDGVWTTTLPLPNGSYEYKFTLDNWTAEEALARTSSCTISTDDGNGNIFTNRVLLVTGDVMLPSNCFSACFACGEGVTITINLGVSNPSESGVWLAGGAEFGAPGGNYQMSDDDGDGIFTISMERQVGYEGYYTFTNGNCPDFSCKENIEGQDCARPENFNDRFFDAVMADVTLNTCFGECTEDTNCSPPAESTMTTFSVDMNDVADVNAEGVRIAGQFSNWGDVEMTDDDGDGVWTVTIELEKGEYEYKFKNGPEGWENLEAGTSCTTTTDDGAFTNRIIDLTNAEATSAADVVCFESCTTCLVNTSDLEQDNNLIKLYPTIAQNMMYLDVLTTFDNGTVQIISLQGALMNTIQIGNNTTGNAIDVANYPQGTYMLSLTTDTFRSTQRFVKM